MDISIIVPFLNEERYIRRCLESLLDQDFDRSRYEVIFIDNGSSDASAEIVKGFPAVQLLTEEKGQVYTARNTGIGVALKPFKRLRGKERSSPSPMQTAWSVETGSPRFTTQSR